MRQQDQANYATFEPSRDLSPFVHRYLHGWRDDDGSNWLRIPPTGGVFLSYVPGAPLRVHFGSRSHDTRSRLFIGGQLRLEQPVLQSLGRFRLVGVELRPTGFYRLMHHAADPFTDDITELHDVFPEQAQKLDEFLDPDWPIEQIIAGVEAFLRRQSARALKTPVVDAAVAQIGHRRGLVDIDEMAGRAGLSGRQFRRQFATVVGVPPKHYAKIVQVNTLIAALMADDTRRLQGLALDHGYYDHAHFVRDFKRFVSLNPSDFLRSGSRFLRTFLGNAAR